MKGILLILLPNTLVLYNFCFAVAVTTRNNKMSYLIVVFAMLLMIFGVSVHDMGIVSNFSNMADPTGFAILLTELDFLSPAEKNVFEPNFAGVLLYNRLFWMAIACIVLWMARRSFTFKRFSTLTEKKSREKYREEIAVPTSSSGTIMPVHVNFSAFSNWKKLLTLAWLDFKSVTRPISFRIFLALLLIIYIFYITLWQQQYYSAAPTLPVTLEITNVTLPLSFYFLMFIIINTTELLFKNQSSGFWTIADALPVPTWVTVISRVTAMVIVGLLLSACLMLFGIMVQAMKGYYHFELGVYITELFTRWTPKYIGYILLTTCIAGITGNRYVTHGISIIIMVVSIVLHEIDVIEQNRLNFIFSPGSGMNTDMNGNGIFGEAHGWYMLYWLSLAIAMLALGILLWQRGIGQSIFKRFAQIKRGQWLWGGMILGGLAIFLMSGKHIYNVVNVQNGFETNEVERSSAANYEQKYKYAEQQPHPLIYGLDAKLDVLPDKRTVVFEAVIQLRNHHTKPIDTLHLEWMEDVSLNKVLIDDKSLSAKTTDDEHRHALYILPHTLQPDDSITLLLSGTLQYVGFTNADPQKDVTYNGSFLPQDIIPYIGYDERRELKENKYRTIYGLPKLEARLPDSTNLLAAKKWYTAALAHKINYRLSISTSATQRIVAPGVLSKQWIADGKNHYVFESSHPDAFEWYILSAQYAVKDTSFLINNQQVALQQFYHPAHAYNIIHFATASQHAFAFLKPILGRYPYDTLRIAERPRYDEEVVSFGNVIVLPENHGWIADIRRREDLDYLHFITASQIAQQYMQQLPLSKTQGFPVVTRSIPAYLALVQLKQYYGDTAVKNHVLKLHQDYMKGRANEKNTEPILLSVDEDANYVSEKKGAVVLYMLAQKIGVENMNRAIRTFYMETLPAETPISAKRFYKYLQQVTTSENQAFLKTAFETLEVISPGK